MHLIDEQREGREPAEALELQQLRRRRVQPEHGPEHEAVHPDERQGEELEYRSGGRGLLLLPVPGLVNRRRSAPELLSRHQRAAAASLRQASSEGSFLGPRA